MAAPTTNIGTVYYFISCGVPSDAGVDLTSNDGTAYFYNPANDYIIWGEPIAYPQSDTNIGTVYYAPKCVVPSDPGLVLSSNAGTHFYYSSSFNCVSFCDGSSPTPPPPLSGSALDLAFALDKSFTVDSNSPGFSLITSRIGPPAKFNRASGATFTDSDGLVKWAAENLLTHSDTSELSPWVVNGSTVRTRVPMVGPRGQATVVRVDIPNQSGQTGLFNLMSTVILAGTQVTISCFVKADSDTDIVLGTNGQLQPTNNRAEVRSVTTTWTRIEFMVTVDPGDGLYFGIGTAITDFTNGNVAVSGARTIYFSDVVKIERSSIARTYLPTTTVPIYGPRFEHDPVTLECKGLLMEEQRTNRLIHSQDFSDASWLVTVGAVKVGVSAVLSPDGTSNAFEVAFGSNGGVVGAASAIYQSMLAQAGAETFTVWVRTISGSTTIRVSAYNGGSDVTDGDITVTNQWQRLTLLLPIGQTVNVAIRNNTAGNSSNVLVWGAQLETGSSPSSYIPTTTASVVRSADVCSIDGVDFTSFYNPSEGTILANAVIGPVESNQWLALASNSTATDSIELVRNSTNIMFYQVYVAGGWQFDLRTPILQANSTHRFAAAYKANDFAFSYDGNPTLTNSTGAVPSGCDRFQIGQRAGASSHNNTIARLTYYPTRLSNGALQALTQPNVGVVLFNGPALQYNGLLITYNAAG